jgi:hypothetical protein
MAQILDIKWYDISYLFYRRIAGALTSFIS